MRFAVISFVLLLASAAGARAGLINGDFETGDLTGWTVFDTTHGGTNLADVTLFDTAVPGNLSDAARFQVGQTSGTIGIGGSPEGAGIFQTITLNSGTLNISVNVAESASSTNGDGGTFELLLNNVVVASAAFGIVGPGTERTTLTYSGTVNAGSNIIAVDARRNFGNAAPNEPDQYFDNVAISGTAVPEPSTAAIALTGAAALLAIRPRRTLVRCKA
jgi:hypothetical protein